MRHLLTITFFFISVYDTKAQDWDDFPMRPEMTEVWNPKVPKIAPGELKENPPSDAIVLFDGTGLSEWNVPGNTKWLVSEGTVTVVGSAANLKNAKYISTKKEFGDIQLHIEWRTPAEIKGEGQQRGNSGVVFQGLYEVQILDSYNNETYGNGQCGSVYKQYAPLLNVCKGPGEWQVYDILFTAPRFNEDGTYFTPPRVTVFHNGVLIQNNVNLRGPVKYRGLPEYYIKKHSDAPLSLQDHGCEVSFRNIWVREL